MYFLEQMWNKTDSIINRSHLKNTHTKNKHTHESVLSLNHNEHLHILIIRKQSESAHQISFYSRYKSLLHLPYQG